MSCCYLQETWAVIFGWVELSAPRSRPRPPPTSVSKPDMPVLQDISLLDAKTLNPKYVSGSGFRVQGLEATLYPKYRLHRILDHPQPSSPSSESGPNRGVSQNEGYHLRGGPQQQGWFRVQGLWHHRIWRSILGPLYGSYPVGLS